MHNVHFTKYSIFNSEFIPYSNTQWWLICNRSPSSDRSCAQTLHSMTVCDHDHSYDVYVLLNWKKERTCHIPKYVTTNIQNRVTTQTMWQKRRVAVVDDHFSMMFFCVYVRVCVCARVGCVDIKGHIILSHIWNSYCSIYFYWMNIHTPWNVLLQ